MDLTFDRGEHKYLFMRSRPASVLLLLAFTKCAAVAMAAAQEECLPGNKRGKLADKCPPIDADMVIKMQALSRGNSTRRNIARGDSTLSQITDESSPNEESQRSTIEDLPTTESFSKDYVDKLKAKLAAKSEDNKKLRASLSKQTAPTEPHDRSEKDGSWLSRFFKHFGRASSARSSSEK